MQFSNQLGSAAMRAHGSDRYVVFWANAGAGNGPRKTGDWVICARNVLLPTMLISLSSPSRYVRTLKTRVRNLVDLPFPPLSATPMIGLPFNG